MGKAGVLERDGEILEVLPAGKYIVKLDNTDLEVNCYKSGKMKQSHISVIVGDWVKVEVNQYDMSQGRIVYRYSAKPINSTPENAHLDSNKVSDL